MKQKLFDQVKPYSYLLTRLADGVNYVGIRYKNVKMGISPEEDFGIKYFSSGSFKKDFKANPSNFKFRILYTFETPAEAAEWEYKILLRVYKRPSWANMTAAWSFTDRSKVGLRISDGKSKIKSSGKTSIQEGADKLKEFIYSTKAGEVYRKQLSERMATFQNSMSTSDREVMQSKRKESMDFFAASAKASITMSKIGSDGLSTLQRKARKANATRAAKGEDLSERGRKMNEAQNKKYGEMSEAEFQEALTGKSDRTRKSLATRRHRYLQALSNE